MDKPNPILARLKELPHIRPQLKPPSGPAPPKPHMRTGGSMRGMVLPKSPHIGAGVRPLQQGHHQDVLDSRNARTTAETENLQGDNAELNDRLKYYMDMLGEIEGGTHDAVPGG